MASVKTSSVPKEALKKKKNLPELDEAIAWNLVAYKATFCAHTCSSVGFLLSQH